METDKESKNLSVYNIIKLLINLEMKGVHNRLRAKCEKRLLSTAYEVILRKSYHVCDRSLEDLKAALHMGASLLNSNEKVLSGNIHDILEDLLERLDYQASLPWNPFDVLKILTLLHINYLRSQNLNIFESFEELLPLSICSIPAKNGLDCKTKSCKSIQRSAEVFEIQKFRTNKKLINTLDLNIKKFMSGCTIIARSVYITRKELRGQVMSALIGIQSESFRLCDGCMTLRKGLYTDGMDPDILTYMLDPILESGSCYLRLIRILNEICFAPVSSYIRHFLGLYHRVVLNLPEDLCITSWLYYISPSSHQINFLTTTLTTHPYSPKVLERLYCSAMNDFKHPYLSVISHTFLLECCQAYFKLLDRWIFEGIWHKDIFIQKNNELNNVSSKEDWEATFSFIEEEAPDFLPCLEVYNCGKSVAFLKLCSPHIQEQFYNEIFAHIGRPRIKLCTNKDELNKQYKEFIAFKNFFDYNWSLSHMGKASVEQCSPDESSRKKYPYNMKPIDVSFDKDFPGVNKSELEEAESNSCSEASTRFQNFYRCKENSGMEVTTTLESLFDSAGLKKVDEYGSSRLTQQTEDPLTVTSSGHLKSLSEEEYSNAGTNESDLKVTSDKHFAEVLTEDDLKIDQLFRVDLENKFRDLEKQNQELTSFEKQLSVDSDQKMCCAENVADDASTCRVENNIRVDEDDEELDLQKIQLKSKIIFRPDNVWVTNALKEHEAYDTYNVQSVNYIEEIVPLREMIINSLIIPLRIQQKLVNNALLRLFMDEKKFYYYAEKLTNIFLMVDGNFTTSIVDSLCTAVEKELPSRLLTFRRLCQILGQATRYSDNNLSFRINYIPKVFELNSSTVFSCLSLTYNIEWPLKYLVTPKMIAKYDSIFAFLLSLERTFWKLKHLYLNLNINSIDIRGPQYRKLQLQRFIMTQFVCSLKSYIQNVVVQDNWKKFIVRSFPDIETVYKTHVHFVKKVRFLCFLGKTGSKLREKIMRLYEIILMYCRIADIGEWTLSDTNVFTHSKFVKLNQYFELFLHIARYITRYVEILVERHQEEVDGLLQFLIVNSFYLTPL